MGSSPPRRRHHPESIGVAPLSENPLNLGVRFALEMAALVALAYWGWATHEGPSRVFWTAGPVLVAATVWATFRVPGDGGAPIVTVPGWLRLLIEAGYFGAAVAGLAAAGRRELAVVFAVILAGHYAASYDRVARLVRRRHRG